MNKYKVKPVSPLSGLPELTVEAADPKAAAETYRAKLALESHVLVHVNEVKAEG